MGRPARSARFAEQVVTWQRACGRHDLPWHGQSDPYRVWLSEIMLQQTQVATVLGYYERFLQRCPDVAALAAAPLDDVLALWSGLGYYSRARNLHCCAQTVVNELGGRFPTTSDALVRLPGIGRSTAAAIAAFCYGERAAILDGNVKRVLTRHLGFDADLSQAASQSELWQLAQDLVPPHAAAAYAQGLMDLGATICLARSPRCAQCPVRATCVARRTDRVQAYPVMTRRVQRGSRSNALLWLRHREQLALVRRPERGVWAGLWSLPEFDDLEVLRLITSGWPGRGVALAPIDHSLTHLEWRLLPLRWAVPSRLSAAQRQRIDAAVPGARWVTLSDALAMSLPAPVRKLLLAHHA